MRSSTICVKRQGDTFAADLFGKIEKVADGRRFNGILFHDSIDASFGGGAWEAEIKDVFGIGV